MRSINDLLLHAIEKENIIYCPFCGEHTFTFNKETGRYVCSSCHTEMTPEEFEWLWKESNCLDHELQLEGYSPENEEPKIKLYGIPMPHELDFKYIVLNYGHHNLWDHSNTTTRYKITNDGVVSIERFTAKGKEKWDESKETKRIKNMKEFYEWLGVIKNIIMTANSAEIMPCDAGGVIETLAYTDFTIKNASMWLANGDKCIFMLGTPELID